MEGFLTALFDFQRFQRNPRLQSVIDDTLERLTGVELSDDALEYLAAAGDLTAEARKDEGKKDT